MLFFSSLMGSSNIAGVFMALYFPISGHTDSIQKKKMLVPVSYGLCPGKPSAHARSFPVNSDCPVTGIIFRAGGKWSRFIQCPANLDLDPGEYPCASNERSI